ncbi:MAG: HAMP domain-containing histidine kinase [Chloroflexi bacterium]|nr:HAMP domain-containing histidine kinase [Chloroflexota bacterium]
MQRVFRQLKWRIIAAHMVVVIVGVVIVLGMASVVMNAIVPQFLQNQLANLSTRVDAAVLAQATDELLETFRNSVFTAVTVAAIGAILAGIMTGLLLAQEILRPLRQIALSSRRIARGQYRERISVPTSDELAEVATNFNQMAESLAQVEQQRVALIGNVSHELRTPLTGLKGYLEGLMDGVFPQNEETYALMHYEVHRMHRLVDDLQSLSRVEAGQLSFKFEQFDLIPIVERVVSQLQPQAGADCLQIHVEPPDKPLMVFADPDRVAQVVMNLIGNGIRYTDEDGRISVLVTAVANQARVQIKDTGIGISESALPYIFERFYRVDPSRTRQSGGSGIGLTISRHLVWGMGGEITAVSAGAGKGSTFAFTLPLENRS